MRVRARTMFTLTPSPSVRYDSARHIGECSWRLTQDLQRSRRRLPPYEAHERHLDLRTPPAQCALSVSSRPPAQLLTTPFTVVEGYREGDYDGKLRKIGHPELCSRQGSEAGTGYGAPQPLPTVGEQ